MFFCFPFPTLSRIIHKELPLNFHMHKAWKQNEDQAEQHTNGHYAQQVQWEKNEGEEEYIRSWIGMDGWAHLLVCSENS